MQSDPWDREATGRTAEKTACASDAFSDPASNKGKEFTRMIYDCIIVGAGASGLFAGARFDTAARGRRARQPPHPSRLPLAWQHPHPAARTKASRPEIDQPAAVLPAARPNTVLPA